MHKLILSLVLGVVMLSGSVWAAPVAPKRAPKRARMACPKTGSVLTLGQLRQLAISDGVRSLVAGLNKKAAKGSFSPAYDAQQCVKGVHQGYFGTSEWFRFWSEFRGDGLVLEGLAVEGLAVEGADDKNATVRLAYRTGTDGNFKRAQERFRLQRVQLDGEASPRWQFVPQVPTEGEQLDKSPLRWAVYMLAQPVGALEKFRAARSQYNLGRLAYAAEQYLLDFDNIFSLRPDMAREAFDPYLRDDKLWVIPGTTRQYVFNGKLTDKTLVSVEDPARTVLFYEGSEQKPLLGPDGKTTVCFVDGHVARVDAKEFEGLQWAPSRPN